MSRELRLLHVRGHEDARVGHDREQRLTNLHELPDLDLLARDDAGRGRGDARVAELQLRVVARRVRCLESRVGETHARLRVGHGCTRSRRPSARARRRSHPPLCAAASRRVELLLRDDLLRDELAIAREILVRLLRVRARGLICASSDACWPVAGATCACACPVAPPLPAVATRGGKIGLGLRQTHLVLGRIDQHEHRVGLHVRLSCTVTFCT